MHRYSVTYIERSGGLSIRTVIARSKTEARKIAEKAGCDDIQSVRHAGLPSFAPIIVLTLVIAMIVLLIIRN